jgi:hypothetical protein
MMILYNILQILYIEFAEFFNDSSDVTCFQITNLNGIDEFIMLFHSQHRELELNLKAEMMCYDDILKWIDPFGTA